MELYKVKNYLSSGIPLSQIPLRVTYYSRVSTDHFEQKSSLINQSDYIKDMINNNVKWTLIKGYIDEGISGTTDYKRINFLKMIEDAKNDMFDLIITKEISRFSRNTLDSIKYSRELLSYGVGVYFINDNINTFEVDSELRLTIMSSLAQDEIRRISERVKFGMLRSINNGVILGNDLQYGYKKDKNSGNLMIIDNEAKIVNRLFTYYAIDHLSLRMIAKIFNEENIKTSLNKKWNITTLKRMIENPKYKGTYCGKKSEIVDYISKKKRIIPDYERIIISNYNKIPPIIDDNLWNLANNRLKSRSQHNEYYKNRYLLSSKLICKNDHNYYHRKSILKSNNDIVWICSNILNNGKQSCNSISIRESEIISILDDILITLDISILKVKNILFNIYHDYNYELDKIINSREIHLKLLELLLDHIIVYNNLSLDIYLNLNNNKSISNKYLFKRGYNTKCTRRYIIEYNVKVYY